MIQYTEREKEIDIHKEREVINRERNKEREWRKRYTKFVSQIKFSELKSFVAF